MTPAGDGESAGRAAITRRAGIVSAGTLFSRLLGWARDAVMSACFAVGATDAFVVAFTIPNALRVLFGEGAVSGAFVPVFAEVREKEGEARARLFYARLVGLMIVVLTIVSALGIVAAPLLVRLYAAGYDAERFETTVALTRVVFPYIFLMGLSALGMGALNSLGRFAVPAFAPALLNVALIAAAFLLVPVVVGWGLPAIGALAVGALAGGVLQVVAQWPDLRKVGMLSRPRLSLRDPWVRKSARLMVPLLAGLGVYQINVVMSRQLASFLPEGAQSYLYYGQRVVDIPQGVFSFAIASAALPTLSALVTRGERAQVERTLGYALRLNLFLTIPSSVALVLLAEPIAAVLFGRGSFGAGDVAETGRSLMWQAGGVWAVASVRTIVPMFHAYNDTRSPVACGAVNLVAFTAISLALMPWLGHVGIAVAFSGASVAQLLSLVVLLRRKAGPMGLGAVARSAVRVALASCAMGAVVWAVARAGQWRRGGNDPANLALFGAAVVAGAVVYLVAARLLGASELHDLRQLVRRRRRPIAG